MRTFAALTFVLALAGPAAAQVYPYTFNDPADNLRWMEQEAQRQRVLQLERDMAALENRVQTEEAVRRMESQRYSTAQARANLARSLEGARVAPGKAADIPDDRLARSNARVRAASKP